MNFKQTCKKIFTQFVIIRAIISTLFPTLAFCLIYIPRLSDYLSLHMTLTFLIFTVLIALNFIFYFLYQSANIELQIAKENLKTPEKALKIAENPDPTPPSYKFIEHLGVFYDFITKNFRCPTCLFGFIKISNPSYYTDTVHLRCTSCHKSIYPHSPNNYFGNLEKALNEIKKQYANTILPLTENKELV